MNAIDFTDAKNAPCPVCGQDRLLGKSESGKVACLWCHEGEKQEPRRIVRTQFKFTPNRNVGQARHSVGRNGLNRAGRQGAGP